MDKVFSAFLRSWLLERKLSPAKGARLFGVSVPTIYSWLKGQLPPKTKAPLLATVLGVDEQRVMEMI